MKIIIPLMASFFFLVSCTTPSQPNKSKNISNGNHEHTFAVQNVDIVEVQKIISDNPNVGIIDVRTPAEFAEGHIKGAVNIDIKSSDFEKQISKMDNQRAYIVYCRSGNRSSRSLPVLKDNHFGTIYHMDKGFNAWKAADLPAAR